MPAVPERQLRLVQVVVWLLHKLIISVITHTVIIQKVNTVKKQCRRAVSSLTIGVCTICMVTVREWCSDWYGEYITEAQTNPRGPDWRSSRVIRGGSWHLSARKCRSADRYDDQPDYRCNDLGFRIVFLE
jgi:hypothetical protein